MMPGIVFTNNIAADTGGAVFLSSLSSKIYLYSTVFSGNNALINGGAVAFQNLVSSVQFYDCSFTSNSAQFGGAMYFGTGNGNDVSKTGLVNVIEFANMTMRHNLAALDGGGIYANNLNSFSMVHSRIVDNVAGRSGGAVFLSQNNFPLKIDTTTFVGNHAGTAGGAISMNTINAMSLNTLTSFVQNSAGTDGGAIFSNASNTVNFVSASTIAFSKNTCIGRGGAFAMNTGSTVIFNSTTTFDSNYAQRQGGAIAVVDSSLVLGPNAITFVNNNALSGSAIYLTSSSTSSVTILPSYKEVLFRNNVCRGGKQGGTVFFVTDPQSTTELFGPQLPHYNQRAVFVNNSAAVGREVATQTTSLRSTSNETTIIVNDYNLFLHPSLAFNLVDAFNNINTTDFATTVSVLQSYPTITLP